MPDEQVPQIEETPDAPDQAAPDGTPADTATPEVNWEERYSNLQPEYTRATQEAAQYREIIDLARQGDPEALSLLGLDLAEEPQADEEPEYVDPDERLSAMEQYLLQRAEQEQQAQQEQEWLAAAEQSVQEQVAQLEKEHGDLSEDDVAYLLDLASIDENGMPDVVGAFERDQQRLDAKRQAWVKSKRAPQVRSGASASSQPNLDDPEERRDYLAQQLAANQGLS